jgi:GNAT superfamily N-acetyltransferase
MGDLLKTKRDSGTSDFNETPPSSAIILNELEIGPLSSEIKRADFCCGHNTIDNFFRNNIKNHHELHKIRAYIAKHGNDVAGYYCLVAQSNLPKILSEEAQKKFERVGATPCVYLSMLGVDKRYQGNGIGKTLTLHAMKKTLEVANIIGIYALTLEAVDVKTSEFYKKVGFEFFTQGDLMMYIPLSTIKSLPTY